MINVHYNHIISSGHGIIKNFGNFQYLYQSNHARLNLICKFMLFMNNRVILGIKPFNGP